MGVAISDTQAFPTLGGGALATVTQVAAPVTWGPSTKVQAAPVVTMPALLEGQNRPGVVYDSSHPRNSFAKKPHVQNGAVQVSQGPAVAIDWSQAGTQAIQQTMLHVAANPTVHGQTPGVSMYPSPPLQVLQQQ